VVRTAAGLTRLVNKFLDRRLPAPPETLRRGPFRRRAFGFRARSLRLTAHLGLALGIAFGICFATGLLSHNIQHPPSWFAWPSRPVGLYRVTQGVRVATGIAAVALLPAKLWSVYRKLFGWPPARDVRHALERLSILVLLGAALFQLATGLLNIAAWYALMPFGFISSHYWVAWLAIAVVLLHIAVKLPLIRGGLARRARPIPSAVGDGGGLTQRGVLWAVGAAATAITLATVGQTVRPLRGLAVLAPRHPDIGPQGLPVNTSARAAGVVDALGDPGYRLVVSGPSGKVALSLAELNAMAQVTVDLPISCVEGGSSDAQWGGLPLRDLVALVGGGDADVDVVSLQRQGGYKSTVDRNHVVGRLTLLALRLNADTLHADHGYPARIIAPNQPGVLQTKWVSELRVKG
jgi:Oxidoreductase molybdopterin binding domain